MQACVPFCPYIHIVMNFKNYGRPMTEIDASSLMYRCCSCRCPFSLDDFAYEIQISHFMFLILLARWFVSDGLLMQPFPIKYIFSENSVWSDITWLKQTKFINIWMNFFAKLCIQLCICGKKLNLRPSGFKPSRNLEQERKWILNKVSSRVNRSGTTKFHHSL